MSGLVALGFSTQAHGASIDHARIAEVVNSVTVLDPGTRRAAPAETNGLFQVPEIMKTGAESRSELVAEDQTITRVGANTLFSFSRQERTINLKQGSLLFQSPTGKGGGTIKTEFATAAVLGTTIIVVTTDDGGFKLLVLEGTGEARLPNGKHIIAHAGQMVYIPPGKRIPGPPLDYRLAEEVKTGRLVYGFKNPLPSMNKIRKAIIKQDRQVAAVDKGASGMTNVTVLDPNVRINTIQARLHPLGAGAAGGGGQAAQLAIAGTGGGTAGGNPGNGGGVKKR